MNANEVFNCCCDQYLLPNDAVMVPTMTTNLPKGIVIPGVVASGKKTMLSHFVSTEFKINTDQCMRVLEEVALPLIERYLP